MVIGQFPSLFCHFRFYWRSLKIKRHKNIGCLPCTNVFWKIWSVSKWNTTFLGRCSGEFLGTTEKLKRWSCFFRTECFKRKFVFQFFKASLAPGLGLRGCFFCQWNSFVQGPVFCLPFIIFHIYHKCTSFAPFSPPPPTKK